MEAHHQRLPLKIHTDKGSQQRPTVKIDKRRRVSVKILSDAAQSDTQSPLTVAETPKTANLKSRQPGSSGKKKLKLKRNCSILGDSSRRQHMISSQSPEGKRYSQHLSFEGILNSERNDPIPSRTHKQQARITQILDSRPAEDSASVQTLPIQKLLIQSQLKPDFHVKQPRPTSSDQQNITVKEFLELKIKEKFDFADSSSPERRPTPLGKQDAGLELVQANPVRVTQSESPPSVADLNQDTDQKKDTEQNDLCSFSANQIRLELAMKPLVINNSNIVPPQSIKEGGSGPPYQMVTRNFSNINTDVHFSVSQEQPAVLSQITKKDAALNTRSRSSIIADQPELKARVSNSTVASSCHSMKPRSRSGVPQFIKIKKVQRQHSADSSTPLHPHILIKKQISEDHSPGSLTLFNNPTFKFKTHHCTSACQCKAGQAKSLSNTSRRIPKEQKPPLSQTNEKSKGAEVMTHQASLSSGIGAISSKPQSMNCHKIKFKRRDKGSDNIEKENNLNLSNFVGSKHEHFKDGTRNLTQVKEMLSSYKVGFTCPKPSPSKFLSSQTPEKNELKTQEKSLQDEAEPSPKQGQQQAPNLQSLYSYKSKAQIIIKQLIKIFAAAEEGEGAKAGQVQPSSKIKQYSKSLSCIFTSLGKAHHMASPQAKPLGQVLLQVSFSVLLLLRFVEDNALPQKSGVPIKLYLQAAIGSFVMEDAEARGLKLSGEFKKLVNILKAEFKAEELAKFLSTTVESLSELTSMANSGLCSRLDQFSKLMKFDDGEGQLQSSPLDIDNSPSKKDIRRKLTDDKNSHLENKDSSKDLTNFNIIRFPSSSSQSKGSSAECDNPTESILRQAKNKYYLRREHLKLHAPSAGSIVFTPPSKAPASAQKCKQPTASSTSTPKKKKFLPSQESSPVKEDGECSSPSAALGKKKKKYTLVLDLDETLVHFDGVKSKFKLRPGCISFLREMSILFEVVIFTAAQKGYADFILNQIEALAAQQGPKDVQKKPVIAHRLYRQNCEEVDGVYVKDLSYIGRDLSRTIIVDNIRDNFERQQDNGIEILTWIDNPEDRELTKLSVFLTQVAKSGVDDVREHVKAYTREVWKCQSPSKRDLSRTFKKPKAGDDNAPASQKAPKRLITPVRAVKVDAMMTPPPAGTSSREGTLNTSSSEKNIKKKDIFNEKAKKIIPIRSSPFHIEKHPSKMGSQKKADGLDLAESRGLIQAGIMNSTTLRQKELGLSPPKRSSKQNRFSGTPQKPLICSPQIDALLSGTKLRLKDSSTINSSQVNVTIKKNGTFDSNKQAFEVLQLSSAKKQANRRQSLNSDIFHS